MYKIFDDIAEFFTELAFIIVLLFFFMSYRFFEVLVLFEKWLPIDLDWMRWSASVMLSIVFIFSTLAFMVNAHRIHKQIKWLLFAIAVFINCYFLEVWHGDWIFKTTVSLIIGSFDVGLSDLFDKMRKERNLGAEKSKLEANVNQLRSKEQQIQANIEQLTAVQKQYIQYQQLLKNVTCPKCQTIYPTKQALNAHVSKCKH